MELQKEKEKVCPQHQHRCLMSRQLVGRVHLSSACPATPTLSVVSMVTDGVQRFWCILSAPPRSLSLRPVLACSFGLFTVAQVNCLQRGSRPVEWQQRSSREQLRRIKLICTAVTNSIRKWNPLNQTVLKWQTQTPQPIEMTDIEVL